YDIGANGWHEGLLALAGRDPDFPMPLQVAGSALGPVRAEVLAATGFAGTPIVGVAGHDHIVGAMACGFQQPGTLVDSMGTAEALLLATNDPSRDFDVIRRGYL